MDSMQVGGYRVYRAFLTDKNGVVVPPLRDAKVTRITERGMVLRGIEQIQERPTPKARVYQYPQVWWVRLQPGQSNVIQLKPSPHPAEVSG